MRLNNISREVDGDGCDGGGGDVRSDGCDCGGLDGGCFDGGDPHQTYRSFYGLQSPAHVKMTFMYDGIWTKKLFG